MPKPKPIELLDLSKYVEDKGSHFKSSVAPGLFIDVVNKINEIIKEVNHGKGKD